MSLELSLIKRVKELEEANGELTEKVFTLEELLGSKEDLTILSEWGLSSQERRIFSVLFKNSITTHDQLFTAAFYGRDEPEFPEFSLRPIIAKMRKKLSLSGFKIKPLYGIGYSLEKPSKVVIYGL